MSTPVRWALRVTVLLIGVLLIAGLIAGLMAPEYFDDLPEPLLSVFRTSTESNLKMYSVSGKITFDGQPIEEGEIRFVPLDKKLNPDMGKIGKGKYAAQVKEGEHLVEIRAKKDDKQYIPARFNDSTELRFHAKDGEQDFELRSTPK